MKKTTIQLVATIEHTSDENHVLKPLSDLPLAYTELIEDECSQIKVTDISVVDTAELQTRTVYEVSGWSKFYIEDVFDEGQIGKGNMCEGSDKFSAPDLLTLIDMLKGFAGVDEDENVGIYTATNGRIDIQRVENREGHIPSKHEVEQWKVRKERLWDVTYTFIIEKVMRQEVVIPNFPDRKFEVLS